MTEELKRKLLFMSVDREMIDGRIGIIIDAIINSERIAFDVPDAYSSVFLAFLSHPTFGDVIFFDEYNKSWENCEYAFAVCSSVDIDKSAISTTPFALSKDEGIGKEILLYLDMVTL